MSHRKSMGEGLLQSYQLHLILHMATLQLFMRWTVIPMLLDCKSNGEAVFTANSPRNHYMVYKCISLVIYTRIRSLATYWHSCDIQPRRNHLHGDFIKTVSIDACMESTSKQLSHGH